jgi:hypothetical protein
MVGFDGGGEDERWEVELGRVCRDGGRVKGGDGKAVEDGGCGFLRPNEGGEGSEDAENGGSARDAKGFCVDGGEGECAFVGDTEEGAAYSMEKGAAGDTAGFVAD